MVAARRRALTRIAACFGPLLLLVVLNLSAPSTAAKPPDPAPESEQADRVLVLKAERRLILFREGRRLAAYDIVLGRNPEGHKRREGDSRTPEGRYRIDWRNPQSSFHLSLHISYPAERDSEAAAARGEDPGGMIMIHGLPNGMSWLGAAGLVRDWTEGCIAVTDESIREIWRLVPDGTPIDIKP